MVERNPMISANFPQGSVLRLWLGCFRFLFSGKSRAKWVEMAVSELRTHMPVLVQDKILNRLYLRNFETTYRGAARRRRHSLREQDQSFDELMVCGTKRQFAVLALMSAIDVSNMLGPSLHWPIPKVVGIAAIWRFSVKLVTELPSFYPRPSASRSKTTRMRRFVLSSR